MKRYTGAKKKKVPVITETSFCLTFYYDIIFLLSHPFWQQEGGVPVEITLSFLVSVMAGIVSYYICKWLDGNGSDN